MKKIKVGIFFGGPSREREISFAGCRTVYDNLNKDIFEAIPIFVDSHQTLIELNWEYIYKGTIRDFYPPASYQSAGDSNYQIYVESLGPIDSYDYDALVSQVGQRRSWDEVQTQIDIAFLALHGSFGEDGQIQSICDARGIPYTGSGVLPCAIGMDKYTQKNLMEAAGFHCPKILAITREEWINSTESEIEKLFVQSKEVIGSTMVIRPSNQGSSIGVSILKAVDIMTYRDSINAAFFIEHVSSPVWNAYSKEEKYIWAVEVSDIRGGIGFPVELAEQTIHHPQALVKYLDNYLITNDSCTIEGHMTEQRVIVESFIDGREFSCIVLRNEDQNAVALPPTEIVNSGDIYDYRSKYLPGLSRKITPIAVSDDHLQAIRSECERLYDYLGFHTYARIDGFINAEGKIFLNDPNTTSGMLPSSFFFHQAAEIGLNPSQFLSFIIRCSVQERLKDQLYLRGYKQLLTRIDESLEKLQKEESQKKKVAVIMGGYSFERHISMESGRNIYEKLASSDGYEPIPIFLMKDGDSHKLYKIPVKMLLKDNADDVRDKILGYSVHPVIKQIQDESKAIMDRYLDSSYISEPSEISYIDLAEEVSLAFIALHGRPGEDGTVQAKLKAHGIPHNGSPAESAAKTIDKYETLQILKSNGFTVADQFVISKENYERDADQAITNMNELIGGFPIIAKPMDDGCSSAVRKIKSSDELKVYLKGLFRAEWDMSTELRSELGLNYNEEFPMKPEVLCEQLIDSSDADHFLEITGGMLTHMDGEQVRFEIFEPSEALATGEVLSLEEKFLAGEGQNITPARFSEDPERFRAISDQVRADLQKAAELLGVSGYSRIDAFVRVKGNEVDTIVIEINSLPGMTPATCIFHQCAINGYKPYEFIDKILQFAGESQSSGWSR